MIILIAISPLFRGLFFNYETYAFLAAIAFLSILYFFTKIRENEPFFINKWFIVSGVLLIAAYAISFTAYVNGRENLESILRCAEYLAVFLVVYDCFYDNKRELLSTVMVPAVLAGLVCAVVGLIALTGDFNIWGVTIFWGRLATTFQYANTASIYFAIVFLFALTLSSALEKSLLRALAVGAGNIFIFALFLTGSRGGYLIGFGAILLFLALQPSGYRIRGLAGFLCALAPVFLFLNSFNAATAAHNNLSAAICLAVSFILAAILYLIYLILSKLLVRNKALSVSKSSGLIIIAALIAMAFLVIIFREKLYGLLPHAVGARLARFNINDINVLYRLDYDKDALKLIAVHWLAGLGGGGWKALYQSVQDYFYTAAFVHNNYLQVFVESGILGFVSYVALVAAGLVSAFISWLRAIDRTMRVYAAGLLCALLALTVHSSFDFDLSFVSMYLLLWVMLAAATVRLPVQGTEGNKFPVLMRAWVVPINRIPVKLVTIVVCVALFSVNALFFAGAYNESEAMEQAQVKNYKSAAVYYEEAYRLDHGNTKYTFELAKLYHYFGNKSTDADSRKAWLERAREMGEKSVGGNRGYPAYMNTLVRIYLDSAMPLKALEYSEKLVSYQKYNSEVYELLAQSYIAAADYYKESGDLKKAEELLGKCLSIDTDQYLLKSHIDRPVKLLTEKQLNSYKHSKKLVELLKEAGNKYSNIVEKGE